MSRRTADLASSPSGRSVPAAAGAPDPRFRSRASAGRSVRGLILAVLLGGAAVFVPGCGDGEQGAENEARSGTEQMGVTPQPSRPFPYPPPSATTPSESSPAGGRGRPGPAAEPGPGSVSPTSTEIPEGGLEDWVEEMRQRLEVIELDPRASYPDVLRLYNTHHGAIERFYGEAGELTGDDHPELAAAVQQQDSAFHELLELTGTTDYIERTHLLHAIRNVRLAMEEVLDRARAADVPLEDTD